MGIFCKLFERDGDQILVRKGVDDDGRPAVIFEFELDPEGELSVSPKLGFNDDDEGWLKMMAAFEKTDAEAAWAFAAAIRKAFNKT